MLRSLVGSEMCIRDSSKIVDLEVLIRPVSRRAHQTSKTPHSWQNNVPESKHMVPGTRDQRSRDQGPGNKNQGPGTRDQEPRTMDQELRLSRRPKGSNNAHESVSGGSGGVSRASQPGKSDPISQKLEPKSYLGSLSGTWPPKDNSLSLIHI